MDFHRSWFDKLGLAFGAMLWFMFIVGLPVIIAISNWCKSHPLKNDSRYCGRCKYNLTGNTSGICPECGAEI
ncbi:MAG TPA: hypothetical protein VIM11_14510 [Tepidisphaeraceae bacterium]